MRQLLMDLATPDVARLAGLLGRLLLDLSCTALIVLFAYHRAYRDRDYTFTYLLLNLVTFSIAFVMSSVPIELGLALGLFAVFGVLRYRTEAIEVRNLTYLFVVIGLALLNAVGNGRISLIELLLVNVLIVAAVCLLEWAPFAGREHSRRVLYDRLDLLSPDRGHDLAADLRARTSLPVERYDIGNVDLLRDTVDITIYYRHARERRR